MTITGEEIHEVRSLCNMTLAEFSKTIEVSPRTLWSWERNGVPESKSARIQRILGQHLTAARRSLHQSAASSNRLGEESSNDSLATPPSKLPNTEALHAGILAPFSDLDLILELARRASRAMAQDAHAQGQGPAQA